MQYIKKIDSEKFTRIQVLRIFSNFVQADIFYLPLFKLISN